MSWKLVRVTTGETWAIPPPPCDSSWINREDGNDVHRKDEAPGDDGFCLGRATTCGVHVAVENCSLRHLHFEVVPPPLYNVLLTPKQFPETSGQRLESLSSSVCGRLFAKCLASSDVLVNGACFQRVLLGQQQVKHEPSEEERGEAQYVLGERLQNAGYVELFLGDIIQVARDASLIFAVAFYPTTFSLGPNPETYGVMQSERESSNEPSCTGERRGRLLQLLEAGRSAGKESSHDAVAKQANIS